MIDDCHPALAPTCSARYLQPDPGCGGFFGTVPHALFDEALLFVVTARLKQCSFHGVAAVWLRRLTASSATANAGCVVHPRIHLSPSGCRQRTEQHFRELDLSLSDLLRSTTSRPQALESWSWVVLPSSREEVLDSSVSWGQPARVSSFECPQPSKTLLKSNRSRVLPAGSDHSISIEKLRTSIQASSSAS